MFYVGVHMYECMYDWGVCCVFVLCVCVVCVCVCVCVHSCVCVVGMNIPPSDT